MEKSGAARVYEALGGTDFNLKSSRCSRASLLAHAYWRFAFPRWQWLNGNAFSRHLQLQIQLRILTGFLIKFDKRTP